MTPDVIAPKFPAQTQLVTVDFLRAVRGISADAIQASVESGELRFVWDVSTGERITALRFWIKEIVTPGSVVRATMPEAIAAILGEHRCRWRGVEVAQMLMVSRPQIHWLRKRRALDGKVVGNTLWIQRAALEKFLTSRYYGHF